MNPLNSVMFVTRVFAVLLLSLGVISCRPMMLYYVAPEGPPEYQLGWQDGCDSGLSAEGDYIYKAMFNFKKRPEMSESEPYKQGWGEGFTYCRFSLAAEERRSKDATFENLGW